MLLIPESYPPPFRFPEIKNAFLLTPDMVDKLRESAKTIEEVGLMATLGIRVVVNPYIPKDKIVWFNGLGKMQILDLSGSSE